MDVSVSSIHVGPVRLHGAHAHKENLGDLPVGFPSSRASKHLHFAEAENISGILMFSRVGILRGILLVRGNRLERAARLLPKDRTSAKNP